MKTDKRQTNNRVILFSCTINNSRGSAAVESPFVPPVLRSVYYKQLLLPKIHGVLRAYRKFTLWRNAHAPSFAEAIRDLSEGCKGNYRRQGSISVLDSLKIVEWRRDACFDAIPKFTKERMSTKCPIEICCQGKLLIPRRTCSSRCVGGIPLENGIDLQITRAQMKGHGKSKRPELKKSPLSARCSSSPPPATSILPLDAWRKCGRRYYEGVMQISQAS
jgi:hypothetical protein